MSNAIRDVVIRVAIEQIQKELRAPDLSPLIQGQKSVGESAKEATVALTEEEKWLNEIKLKAEDANAVWAEQVKLKKEGTEGSIEHRKAIADSVEATKDATHHEQERSAHLTHLARPIAMLARGTEHLIHATIELTAANEEDAQKMVQKFMRYDAYFNLVVGGVHTIHALSHAYEILTAAETAAALAGLAAWAPLLPIIAAVGAAIYVADQAFDAFGRHAKVAQEEFEKFEESARNMEAARAHAGLEQLGERRGIRGEQDAIRGKLFRPDQNLPQHLQDELRLRNELKIATERENDEARNAAKLEDERAETTRHRLEEMARLSGLKGKAILFEEAGGEGGDKIKADIARDIAKTEGEVAALKQHELDLSKAAKDAEEDKRRAIEKQYDTLVRISDNLREQLKLEQDALHTAQAKEESIRGQMQSGKERIGRMNEYDRARLESMAERVASGNATDFEKKELERLGGKDIYDFTNEAVRKGDAPYDALVRKLHGGHNPLAEQAAGIHKEEVHHEDRAAELQARIKENEGRLATAAGKLEGALEDWTKQFEKLLELLAKKMAEEVRKQLDAAARDRRGKVG